MQFDILRISFSDDSFLRIMNTCFYRIRADSLVEVRTLLILG